MNSDVERLFAKAGRAIESAAALLERDDCDFAVSRVYYAMFYVAEALLAASGQRYSSHRAVHGAFGKQFAKTRRLDPKYHGWLLTAFDFRIEGDYGLDENVERETVAELIDQASEFLASAREFFDGLDGDREPRT